MSYDYIDKGNTDGTILGQSSTSLVGFWGVTPVDQAAALSSAATAITFVSASASLSTTISLVAGASGFGFTTTTEAQTFLKAVQNLQIRQAEAEAALVACGLVAGGTETPDKTLTDCVSSGADDGSVLGQSTTSLVGLWGALPVDQPVALTTPVTTTTQPQIIVTVTASQILAASGFVGILAASTTSYGFTTFNAGSTFLALVSVLEDRLAEVEDKLAELGVIAGGTAKSSTALYDYLDKGNDDGTLFGIDTEDLIGFWGTAPCAQPTALTTAAVTIVASISTTTTDNAIAALVSTTDAFGITGVTATQVLLDAVARLQTRMGEMESALETPGLIADDSVG